MFVNHMHSPDDDDHHHDEIVSDFDYENAI
jgi:hypothetical protein